MTVSTQPPDRIVVGMDESEGAAVALRWAVAEAEIWNTELTAVMAWGFVDQHHATLGEPFDPSYSAADARDALRSYITAAVGRDQGAGVHSSIVCDLPARALLDASRTSDLLVVGARGLGGFRGLLLGSVSQHCLHHTTVPIAIIRDEFSQESGTERVVVGVDGSDHARRALQWAADEARRRGARLDVVMAWELPYVGALPPTSVLDPAVYEHEANTLLERCISLQDASGPGPEFHPVAMHGGAADVLLDYAAGAGLLVVGSRGQGALKRAVLGSVATQVAQRASCPTVVVPATSFQGR